MIKILKQSEIIFVKRKISLKCCVWNPPHKRSKSLKMYICPVEYEIKPHRKLNLGLKEIWQFREMLFFLYLAGY